MNTTIGTTTATMNTTGAVADTAEAEGQQGSPKSTKTARRGLKRRAAILFATIVGAIAGIGLFSSPASAAANQWIYYDLVANNGVYEMAIWYDAYGRPTQVYADLNANRTWDAYSQLRNGYPIGWLLNTVTEFDGRWDALISSNGDRWSNSAGCNQGASGGLIGGGYYSSGTQVMFNDNVYGLAWCYRPTRFSGVISAPIHEDMLVTLARLAGVAPALHCYTYPTAVGCYGRNW